MAILTQEEFNRFAALSGDDNPIHVDPQFAARTRFRRTAAHGMFLYSLLCAEWGRRFPGARQLAQELVFRTPTYAGEPVMVDVRPHGEPSLGQVSLVTNLLHISGEAGAEGTAILRLPQGPTSPEPAPSTQPPPAGVEGAQTHKGLRLGQRSAVTRTFTPADLAEYIALTGDANPLYTSPEAAAGHGCGAPPLPGPLLGGLFSYLLGTRLPGRGTNWLKQRLAFPRPAYPGEPITATVEVVRLRPEKDLVNLRTWCEDGEGSVVCEGEALVYVRDLE